MGKSIISKGKTVKEAVHAALELLDARKTEVDIEIIRPEIKGILGIGAKLATVRVTVKEGSPAAKEELFEKLIEEINDINFPTNTQDGLNDAITDLISLQGKVWVSDGQIFCKDTFNVYPLLTPVKGIRLYKNDELVDKTVAVSEQDIVRVEIEEEIKEPIWEIKMNESKMEVTLTINPGFRKIRKLKDQKPSSHIELAVEDITQPIPVQTNDILNKLKEIGVVQGIDYTDLVRACETKERGVFIIAAGIKPLPGKHGSLVSVVDTNVKTGPKERVDGKVDYREIREFPSIEVGQTIGLIHPPIPGKPGVTVTGDTVPPAQTFPMVIREGKGVALVEGDSKIIATEAGQPSIKIKGITANISIVQKLTYGRDVSLETGNIHFTGDVEIIGSVQDGMTVQVEGNVYIHENVNMAKITSCKSIIIGNNIISSDITAGNSNIVVAELTELLTKMLVEMKKMVGAIVQVSQASAFKMTDFSKSGLGPLIKIMLDGKFKSFHQSINSFLEITHEGKEALDEGWLEFADSLYKSFIYIHSSQLKSVDDMIRITQKAEELYQSTFIPDEPECFIQFQYAHNSKIYCNGNITVLGQGSYNSRIYAVGLVQVNGFVRGGEIYAGKGVKLDVAGTKGGTFTKIVVPQNETIEIKHVMEDTVIQIGTKVHKFSSEMTNIYARLNEVGDLIYH